QLNKKLDVIKVKTFAEEMSISRELMLIKVKYNKGNRRDIMETCSIMGAQIVDMSKTHMIIQVCDVPERTALFIKMLNGISIIEVARTGTLALQKCAETE
ncbi:MAG: acetolactate synthase small subunit, partial [Lachnospiraceae bacterium]|nr:acetolactate synthase small subunit [Lachnospiraceae bacterium]